MMENTIQRRDFIKVLGLGLAGHGVVNPLTAGTAANQDRIGCTTVCFRTHFAATRPKGYNFTGKDLNLLDVPSMFVEKLGIHNVELWSKHFPEASVGYGEKIRKAASRADARILNIQLDEPPFDLCSPNKEKREACLMETMRWMDITASCGAPTMRANVGGRKSDKLDLSIATDSFQRLAEYGDGIGVKILVENHGGMSSFAENVVAILDGVEHPNIGGLTDFGNIPAPMEMPEHLAFLKKLLPHADLISAKGKTFDENYKHISYDFGACVRTAEKVGFKGVYSIEMWAPDYIAPNPVRAIKALKRTILKNLA